MVLYARRIFGVTAVIVSESSLLAGAELVDQSQSVSSLSITSGSLIVVVPPIEERTCRICLSSGKDLIHFCLLIPYLSSVEGESLSRLFSPCLCSGSMR